MEDKSLLLSAKLQAIQPLILGLMLAIKPDSLDVIELGNYEVLFILSSNTLEVSISCPACLTLTLQLLCLIRVIFNLPSAETLCAAMYCGYIAMQCAQEE